MHIGDLPLHTTFKFEASPYDCNFSIENHFSLAKWPPLLSVASSASACSGVLKQGKCRDHNYKYSTYLKYNVTYC